MLDSSASRTSRGSRLSWVLAIGCAAWCYQLPDTAWAQDAVHSTNYKSLTEKIDITMRRNLFSAQAWADPATQGFLASLRELANRTDNDQAFLRGFYDAARKLPYSHVDLVRPQPSTTPDSSSVAETELSMSDLSVAHDEDVSVVSIRSFNEITPQELVTVFSSIRSAGSKGLIIDLRTNRGGTYMSLAVAGHLIDSPAKAGVIFSGLASERVLRGDLSAFPVITPTTTPLDRFFALMAEHGAVVGQADPLEPHFAGPVAVLTSRITASACEPLVEFLKRTGRATIIGEKTAGAVLSASPFDVGQGWTLAIPVFDYMTAENRRIDGHPIEPDIAVPSANAMKAAREWLDKNRRATSSP